MLASARVVRYHIAVVSANCAVCGRIFWTFPRQLRRVKEPSCSRQCNGKRRGAEWKLHAHKGRAAWTPETTASFRAKMSGARNPAWKGGVTYFKTHGAYTGVRYVRAPEWARPMARADGYVMEHRLLMAQMVGRLLERREVVHHRDHVPSNNLRANLELWPDNRAHKLAEHGRCAEGAANRVFRAA